MRTFLRRLVVPVTSRVLTVLLDETDFPSQFPHDTAQNLILLFSQINVKFFAITWWGWLSSRPRNPDLQAKYLKWWSSLPAFVKIIKNLLLTSWFLPVEVRFRKMRYKSYISSMKGYNLEGKWGDSRVQNVNFEFRFHRPWFFTYIRSIFSQGSHKNIEKRFLSWKPCRGSIYRTKDLTYFVSLPVRQVDLLANTQSWDCSRAPCWCRLSCLRGSWAGWWRPPWGPWCPGSAGQLGPRFLLLLLLCACQTGA